MHINKKLLIARIIKKIFIKKPIILVSDRIMSAGDNGEVFFEYIQKKDIISYFELSEKSLDFERMKKKGSVVKIDSKWHKILLFFADAYISSQIEWYKNRQSEIPYIFLQHGVTEKDISEYIKAHFEYRKKGYIVCSTYKEFDAFCKKPYTFGTEHILFTGLPRFDKLYDSSQKIVMLSLTWRANMVLNEGIKEEDFIKTNYYKDIKSICENDDLQYIMEKYGYKLYVKLHPMMEKFIECFEKNSKIILWKASYNEMFAKSNILITDYSSIAFDFAYLNKPVVYFQPMGREEKDHVWKGGLFSYENDGFGEVTKSIEELVKILCIYIQNNCKLHEKYKNRIVSCFKYVDKKNCERVYDELLNIIKEQE